MLLPTSFAKVASDGRERRHYRKHDENAKSRVTRQPSATAQSGCDDQAGTDKAHCQVDINEVPFRAQRSGIEQHESRDRAEKQENHACAEQEITLPP